MLLGIAAICVGSLSGGLLVCVFERLFDIWHVEDSLFAAGDRALDAVERWANLSRRHRLGDLGVPAEAVESARRDLQAAISCMRRHRDALHVAYVSAGMDVSVFGYADATAAAAL